MKSLNEAVRKEIEVGPGECSTGLVICIHAYQWQRNKVQVETLKSVPLKAVESRVSKS